MKIGHTDLIAVVEKGKGLSGANPGKVGCTAPWSRLQSVGLSAMAETTISYTGNVELAIGQGGIRNEHVSKNYRSIFKKEVLPAIVNSSE